MKIGVCGLGLIGGSLYLRLRRRGFNVAGFTRSSHALEAARRKRVKIATLEQICRCDVIFLTGRMSRIPSDIEYFAKHCDSKTLLVDVASLKRDIVKFARKFAGRYISAHPIAGNETSGMENANASIFEGTPFLILPVKCKNSDIQLVRKIAVALGARPVLIRSAEQHDRWFADSIGLPHCAAFAIRSLCKNVPDFMKGPSYRSATRVSNSDVEFVAQMLFMNRVHMKKELRHLCKALKHLEKSLKSPEATMRCLKSFL